MKVDSHPVEANALEQPQTAASSRGSASAVHRAGADPSDLTAATSTPLKTTIKITNPSVTPFMHDGAPLGNPPL